MYFPPQQNPCAPNLLRLYLLLNSASTCFTSGNTCMSNAPPSCPLHRSLGLHALAWLVTWTVFPMLLSKRLSYHDVFRGFTGPDELRQADLSPLHPCSRENL